MATLVYCGHVKRKAAEILGYAYAGAHRARAAYQWSVDTTVYVHPGAHRSGVGDLAAAGTEAVGRAAEASRANPSTIIRAASRELEAAGVSGIEIEDNVVPRHFGVENPGLNPVATQVGKLEAAVHGTARVVAEDADGGGAAVSHRTQDESLRFHQLRSGNDTFEHDDHVSLRGR